MGRRRRLRGQMEYAHDRLQTRTSSKKGRPASADRPPLANEIDPSPIGNGGKGRANDRSADSSGARSTGSSSGVHDNSAARYRCRTGNPLAPARSMSPY
jgi:hypothetical protein